MTLPFMGGVLPRPPARAWTLRGLTLPSMGGESLFGPVTLTVFRVDLLVGSPAVRGCFPGRSASRVPGNPWLHELSSAKYKKLTTEYTSGGPRGVHYCVWPTLRGLTLPLMGGESPFRWPSFIRFMCTEQQYLGSATDRLALINCDRLNRMFCSAQSEAIASTPKIYR